MRGELERVEGVMDTHLTIGERPFTITYDPKLTNTEEIQAALDKSGFECGPQN